MNFVEQAVAYLLTAGNWTGPVGLAARTLEHLEYTAVAVAASALVAIPLGLIIGHTGRGTLLVVGLVNALRALPTLGVLLLGVLLFGLRAGPAAGRPDAAGYSVACWPGPMRASPTSSRWWSTPPARWA